MRKSKFITLPVCLWIFIIPKNALPYNSTKHSYFSDTSLNSFVIYIYIYYLFIYYF